MIGALTIRRMRPADATAVAELNGQLGYPSAPDEVVERLAAADGAHGTLLVAEEDDRVIGWVHVALKASLLEERTAQVMGIVVDASHRGAGVGTRLMAEAEAWATARGARRLIVGSRVTRERAHAFYLERGYALHKTSRWFEKRLARHGQPGPGG